MNKLVSFRECKLSMPDLLAKIDVYTDEMFKSQKVPTRHIPARPDDDYDLLIGELILRVHEMQCECVSDVNFSVCTVTMDYENEVFEVTPKSAP